MHVFSPLRKRRLGAWRTSIIPPPFPDKRVLCHPFTAFALCCGSGHTLWCVCYVIASTYTPGCCWFVDRRGVVGSATCNIAVCRCDWLWRCYHFFLINPISKYHCGIKLFSPLSLLSPVGLLYWLSPMYLERTERIQRITIAPLSGQEQEAWEGTEPYGASAAGGRKKSEEESIYALLPFAVYWLYLPPFSCTICMRFVPVTWLLCCPRILFRTVKVIACLLFNVMVLQRLCRHCRPYHVTYVCVYACALVVRRSVKKNITISGEGGGNACSCLSLSILPSPIRSDNHVM